jgi:hypothetical protein
MKSWGKKQKQTAKESSSNILELVSNKGCAKASIGFQIMAKLCGRHGKVSSTT